MRRDSYATLKNIVRFLNNFTFVSDKSMLFDTYNSTKGKTYCLRDQIMKLPVIKFLNSSEKLILPLPRVHMKNQIVNLSF